MLDRRRFVNESIRGGRSGNGARNERLRRILGNNESPQSSNNTAYHFQCVDVGTSGYDTSIYITGRLDNGNSIRILTRGYEYYIYMSIAPNVTDYDLISWINGPLSPYVARIEKITGDIDGMRCVSMDGYKPRAKTYLTSAWRCYVKPVLRKYGNAAATAATIVPPEDIVDSSTTSCHWNVQENDIVSMYKTSVERIKMETVAACRRGALNRSIEAITLPEGDLMDASGPLVCLYETDLDYVARYVIDTSFQPGRWYYIDRVVATTNRMVTEHQNNSPLTQGYHTCTRSIVFDERHQPLKSVVKESMDTSRGTAPLVLISIDIECMNYPGCFPSARHNPIIDVSLVVCRVCSDGYKTTQRLIYVLLNGDRIKSYPETIAANCRNGLGHDGIRYYGNEEPPSNNATDNDGDDAAAIAYDAILDERDKARGLPPVECLTYTDELAMLIDVAGRIRALDPDVLLGYNSDNFDFKYIYDRVETLIGATTTHRRNVTMDPEIALRWGRGGERIRFARSMTSHRTRELAIIAGRVVIDMYTFVTRQYENLRSYKLDDVAKHFLKTQKNEMPPNKIGQYHVSSPLGTIRVALYCVQDAQLVVDLAGRLSALEFLLQYARITGARDCIRFGQQLPILLLLRRFTTRRLDNGSVVRYLLPDRLFKRFRDPRGIRPFVYGFDHERLIAEMEAVAGGEDGKKVAVSNNGGRLVGGDDDTDEEEERLLLEAKRALDETFGGDTTTNVTTTTTTEEEEDRPQSPQPNNTGDAPDDDWAPEDDARRLGLFLTISRARQASILKTTTSVRKELLPMDTASTKSDFDYMCEYVSQTYNADQSSGKSSAGQRKVAKAKGRKTGYDGAVVLPPRVGFYPEGTHIVVLDFKSLYPSIIRAYNMCHTTLIAPYLPYYKELMEDASVTKEISTEGGVAFAQDTIGILPEACEQLTNNRVNTKALMKSVDKNSLLYTVLDNNQLATKCTTNSIYGVSGAAKGRMPNIDVAAQITRYGQKLILATRDYILTQWQNETSPELSWIKPDVIYGDTDSVFVCVLPDERFAPSNDDGDAATSQSTHPHWRATLDLDTVFNVGNDIVNRINPSFKPPVELEFEKVYNSFVLIAKKKYFGFKWERPNGEKIFDSKGIETRRRDNAAFVGPCIQECINILLEQKAGVDALFVYLKSIATRQFELEDLALSTEYKRTKTTNMQPHTWVAYKMRLRDPNSAPKLGDRIKYVIISPDEAERITESLGLSTKEHPTSKVYAMAESFDYVLEHGIKPNIDYYISRQLMGPISRIVDPILGDGVVKRLFVDVLA